MLAVEVAERGVELLFDFLFALGGRTTVLCSREDCLPPLVGLRNGFGTKLKGGQIAALRTGLNEANHDEELVLCSTRSRGGGDVVDTSSYAMVEGNLETKDTLLVRLVAAKEAGLHNVVTNHPLLASHCLSATGEQAGLVLAKYLQLSNLCLQLR